MPGPIKEGTKEDGNDMRIFVVVCAVFCVFLMCFTLSTEYFDSFNT